MSSFTGSQNIELEWIHCTVYRLHEDDIQIIHMIWLWGVLIHLMILTVVTEPSEQDKMIKEQRNNPGINKYQFCFYISFA